MPPLTVKLCPLGGERGGPEPGSKVEWWAGCPSRQGLLVGWR